MQRVTPKRIEPIENGTPGVNPNSKRYSIWFWLSAALILAVLSWAYARHFDNPFHFDDDHTIVRNSSLDTMNVSAFFSDPRTFSTLPANQAWRPGVTILNSVDTILSKDRVPDPVVFHIHIFISYILLGIAIFFMILFLLRKIFPDLVWTNWAALFATGLFWLHTANAETINYIISRSDSQSTLFIVAGLLMFMYSEISRKYYLYIIPMAIGFLVKETALMLAPLLIVFCWLFTPKFTKNLLGLILTFVAAGTLLWISQTMTLDTWTSGAGAHTPFEYLCTEAFVIVHYFFTFILPANLSADTDWTFIVNPFDTRVMVGALFIGLLIWLAFRWSRKEETKIAAFGIFWFFIALAPTSSVVPFAEVMNDHRIFFPFIGLILVVTNFAVLAYRRFETQQNSMMKIATICGVMLLLLGHSVGTRHRCEVWGSGESLWKDVTEKSPGNPRGWMNYGLAVMPRNLDSAIILFNKTISITPLYSYAHVNMGIAQDRKGNLVEAENEFRLALRCDSTNPEPYYFYGEWLMRHERVTEGLANLRAGHAISPGHSEINNLLAAWEGHTYIVGLQGALEAADANPTPENLVALSLEWYKAEEYLQCVLAAEKAVELKPDYNQGWNNICAGYNKLGEFDKAIEAGNKAVALLPNDELSINNLSFAVSEKKRFDDLTADAEASDNYDKWINLSLAWYMAGNFQKSLSAAEEAVKLNPQDATGWNNVCAAANKTGQFDRAMEAGEKAVELSPDWEMAKNNLAEAKRLKEKSGQ